jgi:glutamate N-acetyltransferase/amino-acid N-acetyltransferase
VKKAEFSWVSGGGITTPFGFQAGATYANIRTYGPEPRRDVGVVRSDKPATVAGVFTKNKICGAPVTLCRERVATGTAQLIIANSGCSNVANGQAGIEDAQLMARLAADKWGVQESHALVASTGVIGRRLPMDKIRAAIEAIELGTEGGADFSRSIMTTDTVPKECALGVTIGDTSFTVAASAKGAGMAHPDMATVLVFVTTDARVAPAFLAQSLREVADQSVNRVDIDMDTSTSDMMLVLANGAANGPEIDENHELGPFFKKALLEVGVYIARELARDGEGARTLITVKVTGAESLEDARTGSRVIASSPLVKTMVTGRDPNPGRILMAIGRAGIPIEPEKISVSIQGRPVFERGEATALDTQALKQAMDAPEVEILVDLAIGDGQAISWGCDLTEDYVRINADYTT